MYVVIGQNTYREISNLKFSPQVSLISESQPINFFTVDIKSATIIPSTGNIKLYDDSNRLYASFYITSVVRKPDQIYSVRAEDIMSQLDTVILESDMIETPQSFRATLEGLQLQVYLASNGKVNFSIGLYQDTYLQISGFLPQQTARERLMMIAFAAGAFVSTCFTDTDLTVKKFDTSDTPTYIPEEKIYWRPQKIDKIDVTDLTIHSYSFAQVQETDIKPTDDYVVAYQGGRYFRYLDNEFHDTVIQSNNIKNVTISNFLVTSNNINDLASNLRTYYQNLPGDVTAEVLCTGAPVKVGDYVSFCTGQGREIVSGYVVEEDFKFGKNNRVKIKIHGVIANNGVKLTVRHMDNNAELKRDEYIFPNGYSYSITTKALEMYLQQLGRYIFYPLVSSISGTITQDTTANINYGEGLRFTGQPVLNEDMLIIYNVDGATDNNGVIEIEGN